MQEPLTLQQIAEIDWCTFTDEAKRNPKLLKTIYKYAEPLHHEIALLLVDEELDGKTSFVLQALYHILTQWVVTIPNLLKENLDNDSAN